MSFYLIFNKKLINFVTKIPLTMRLLVLSLFFSIGVTWANQSYAQNAQISIDAQNQSIAEILETVEQQSEFSFIYDSKSVDTKRKVSVHAEKKSIFDVLDQMFTGSEVAYTVINKKIILNKGEVMLNLVQQGIPITGTVTDAAGEPMPGVNVLVKGTTTGVVTDLDGKYSINVSNEEVVLVFSFIGYTSQEIAVADRQIINVVLSEDVRQIDEVVVVGYGTQKKVNLTGAVAVVSGQDIVSKASTDVLSAMQGQMPGVAILRKSGQPGTETDGTSAIRIRGFSSTNDAYAMILIDGVEGNLQSLNADDIESVSVLKDAAAASIYGARAAAGVILVTTKKGVAQRTKISYNGSFGFDLPGLMPKRLPPWEEQEMINIARFNNTGAPEQNPEATSWIGNPNYNYYPNGTRWTFHTNSNWLHEGTKEYSTQQTHSVSVSGGNDKTTYYVSGGFYTKGGMLKYGPDNFNRINLRASMNTEFSKYLDFNMQMAYEGSLRKENTLGAESVLSTLYQARGRQAIYLPEEDTNYGNNIWSADLQSNVIQAMKEGGERRYQTQYFTGNATLRIKNLVQGLTLDLNVSRRAGFQSDQSDYRFLQSYGKDGAVRSGYDMNNPQRVIKAKSNSYQDKLEALLNYDLKWSEHHLHLLGGASYEQYLRDQISAEARNGLSNDFFSFNYYANDVATNTVLSDQIQPWKMASLFGRANYDFAGRYLLEATLRYDGSSRLAPGNRWGLFPSVSAGWRISEEAFFEGVRQYVNNFKLRASWGQLGNSTVLNSMYYPYYGLISNKTESSTTSVLSIMGNPVYYQKEMVSKNVAWETASSTNVGIDLGFLNNRLNVTADYYWKRNDEMLAQLRVGNIVGVLELPYQNVGILKTWGWEVSLQWRDRIDEVSYNVGFNIDDSQNKLISYEGSNTIKAGAADRLEGYALNTIWGYQTDGFWTSRDEYLAYKDAHPGYESLDFDAKLDGGDVRYVAQGKADHKIGIGGGTPEDPGDLVYLGTTNGRYLYGINLGVQWKGFDFSMFFQGVGYRKFIIDPGTLGPLTQSQLMPWTIHRDYWTEDNPNAYFARLVETQTYNYQSADRWVQNGAYIRLKNIQLGYTIPIPKNVVQSLRVFVVGSDVWEHTKVLKAFDPEVGNNKNRNYYPFFRTWTMGVNLTF